MGKPGVFKKINNQDQSITPFKVYKSWRYTSTGSLSNDGIDRLVAIKPNKRNFVNGLVSVNTFHTNFDTGSYLINAANDKAASLIWYSLDHLYYKRSGQPYNTFGNTNTSEIERTLYNEATVLSIPQKKFGESIKPGSVLLRLYNSQLNAASMSLRDDGHGNLIDTELSSSISNEQLYLGFNSMTYEDNYTSGLITSENTNGINPVLHRSIVPELNVTSKNVWITPSYNLPSESLSRQWGNSARLYQDSYIRIPNQENWNFKLDENFAISFWYYKEAGSTGTIVSKRKTGTGNYLQNNIIHTGDVNYNSGQYPFEITSAGSDIQASISNGLRTSTLTYTDSSTARNHLVFQKSGSAISLYINGTLQDSDTMFTDGFIHNKSDVFIGSLGLDSTGSAANGFTGAIDEFFIFNKALTQDEINQLANPEMSINTNRVGTVFYEHGLIVLSDPRPKYGNNIYRMFNDAVYNQTTNTIQPSYLNSIYLEFNSTVTLYEHEYLVRINEDEFNFTSNATIRKNNDLNSPVPKDIVLNDAFAPYITTIGLYTENGELVAIGKLGTPIKKRDDVDLSIVVRFDV